MKRAASSRAVPDCEMVALPNHRLYREGRARLFRNEESKAYRRDSVLAKKSNFRDEGIATQIDVLVLEPENLMPKYVTLTMTTDRFCSIM